MGPPRDHRAEFEEEALPHFDAVFNMALSLTRNRRDAEDLVQETFLKAFRFFDSYRPGTHIKAWLFRILRNAFINRYRAAKVRPEELDFSAIESSYESLVEDRMRTGRDTRPPDALVIDESFHAEVQQAVLALPEEYRSVVLMALLEEMSYKEIAAAMSIPIGTVMSRLHRGRRELQARLLDHVRRRGIVRAPPDVSNRGKRGP